MCYAESVLGADTWRVMDDAHTAFERGDFGEALIQCEKARKSRLDAVAAAVATLDASLIPAEVRKKGDNIDDIRSILAERNDTAALAIIDEVLLTHEEKEFNGSISAMKTWISLRSSYPEADVLEGMVYEAESEYDVALSLYERAWANRNLLEVPNEANEIAFRMANLAHNTDNPGLEEKSLLLVLGPDELYGTTAGGSASLAAMTRTLEKESDCDKFFLLYRHDRPDSLEASVRLARVYLGMKRLDRAFPVAAIAGVTAITELSAAMSKKDFSYTYSSLADLMLRSGRDAEISSWANSVGIWDAFLTLGQTLAAKDMRSQARSLYVILAENCPNQEYRRKAQYASYSLKQ